MQPQLAACDPGGGATTVTELHRRPAGLSPGGAGGVFGLRRPRSADTRGRGGWTGRCSRRRKCGAAAPRRSRYGGMKLAGGHNGRKLELTEANSRWLVFFFTAAELGKKNKKKNSGKVLHLCAETSRVAALWVKLSLTLR